MQSREALPLGGLSLGLGLAQILAPRTVARWTGLPDRPRTRALLRAMGARELLTGAGLLSGRNPALWAWARVGGDVIDLALLGTALASPEAQRGRLALTIGAVGGIAALDLAASGQLGQGRPGQKLIQTVTIKRSPEEVYSFWRNLENLPRFMRHLEAVRVIDARQSHWQAEGPAGTSVTWFAEIVDDQPNYQIAWRSLPGAAVANEGVVRFVPAPQGRGTVVRLSLRYSPPAGKLGALGARALGVAPEQEVPGELRRLKQVLETGEVMRSDARDGRHDPLERPAQPLARAVGEG